MAFNAKKCHVMSITRKRDKPIMQYRLGDNPLSVVDTFTYLGVTSAGVSMFLTPLLKQQEP